MHALRVDALDDVVQLRHPALREVAVLQAHPHPLLHRLTHERLRFRALALPEGHLVKLPNHLGLVRKLQKIRHRVRAGREHEDQRRRNRALGVTRREVKRRRLDEPFAELERDKVLHAEHEAIRADASNHEQLLERVELLVEVGVELVSVRVRGLEVRAVVVHVVGERRREALKGGKAREVDELDPHLLRDPVRRGVRLRDVRVRGTGEQEAPLQGVDETLLLHDRDREKQRKHELVRLEERQTHVVVQRIREVLVQDLDPLLDVLVLLRFFDAADKQRDEPREGVLVHRVHEREVGDAKEQNRRARRHRAVLLSRRVDVLLRALRLRHLLRDFVRRHLRLRQRVDENLVVEDVPGGVGQEV